MSKEMNGAKILTLLIPLSVIAIVDLIFKGQW